MSADVGSKAPDFTLSNQDKQPVTLSAQAGKTVVLAFFPAAFTSVCQKELCHFRDQLAAFNSVNATVFGISVDTPFTLKEFARQNSLNFDLLSDFNKDAIQKFDVVNPDMGGLKGISRRAVLSSMARASSAIARSRQPPATSLSTTRSRPRSMR